MDGDLSKSVFYAMLSKQPSQIEIVIKNELFQFLKENLLLFMKYLDESVMASENETHFQEMVKSDGLQFVVKHTDRLPV